MAEVFTAMGSALYSKLAAGTALTNKLGGTEIWDTLVPQGTDPPYVVFNFQAGGDDNTSPRRARSVMYQVKAISTASLEAAEIDSLIDASLHEQTLTVTGWGNYWLARTTDVAYTQEAGGVLYWHRGGLYRIRIAET